jgi:phosphatidylglycerol:prolipoprotein diacylglycerol transferase
MVMLGFLFGIIVASHRAKKAGLNPEIIFDVGIIFMVGGIIGARIAYIVIFNDQFSDSWKLFNIFDGELNMIGVIAGWFIPFIILLLAKKKILFKNFSWFLPITIISAAISGRIVEVIINRKIYDFSVFEIWKGGLVFYGGLILAIPVGLYYLKKRNTNAFFVGDIIAPSVALGLAFGRIGCFLNGCCYGAVSKSNPLAICFPNLSKTDSSLTYNSPAFSQHVREHLVNQSAKQSLPVQPTQIYESLFCICLFIFLSFLAKKNTKHGLIIGLLVIIYSIGRFIIELYRGDKTAYVMGLTDSQLISLATFATGLIFTFIILKKKQNAGELAGD